MEELAESIVHEFTQSISDNVRKFVRSHDTLDLSDDLTLLGGGVLSEYIVPRVTEILGCGSFVPEFSEVAGAVGCALSRVSSRTRIHADTDRGLMTVNGAKEDMDGDEKFSEEDWRKLGKKEALDLSREAGSSVEDLDEVQIKSLRYFNVVEGRYVKGQICDIEAQVEPGISNEFDLEKLKGEDS